MTLAVISHPDCLLHDMNHLLPEVPARLRAIDAALSEPDIGISIKNYSAPIVTREQLLRVHKEEYIEYILQSTPQEGFVCLDPDTWMNPHSLQAAWRAAGATVYGVDLVLSGEVDAAFCNVRPPGHHAERAAAMGFCIFNNVAVGVAHALEQYNIKRIVIVDFDAHHGNGIEDIFKHEERVLYCSSFEHPFYPNSGADTKNNHIINIPLPAGTSGKIFREKVEQFWFERIIQFEPEMIFFSAGFDAYYKDPIANLMFNEDDYAWITRKIMQIAHHICQGRVVSALEGGYALETLGQCVLAHIRELHRVIN